jgi:hypothetical protein
MKAILLAILITAAHLASGATYYVRTDGDNGNAGTADNSGGAWRNIWYAANNVSAGDTVQIGAGEFREFITNTVSGTAGSPITFVGTRSGATWQTIIDPSTSYASGWVAAPEIGTGVYKRTLDFVAREMTIGGKRLAYLHAIGDLGFTGYGAGAPTTGAGFLTLATDATINSTLNPPHTIEWWESVKAAFCSDGTTCYLRLRDGSDPNGLDIRAAANNPARVSVSDVYGIGVRIINQSYLTYSNLSFKVPFWGFHLQGASHHINIVSNKFTGGYCKVYMQSGPYQNQVTGNEMTANYYGFDDIGAWGGSAATTTSAHNRENLFNVSKYLMNPDLMALDDSIKFIGAGNSNVIAFNYFHDILGNAIWPAGTAAFQMTNTMIYSNSFANMQEAAVRLLPWQRDTRVFGNAIRDCGVSFRVHQMDDVSVTGETNRQIFVYRNTCYQPEGLGDQIYFHFHGDGADAYAPEIWFYHNSFSGGYHGITPGEIGSTGLTNVHFLNNVFSDVQYDGVYNADDPFILSAWMVGQFDYNVITPPWLGDPVWRGENCVTNELGEWTNAENMGFALAVGSPAIDAGLNIPATYPALPFTGTQSGSAWDIGAVEYGATEIDPPADPVAGTANIGTLILR